MLEKFNHFLRLPERLIPCDKRMHFMVGAIFTAILLLFVTNTAAVASSLLIFSISIEIYQKITDSGQFDLLDALATAAGGFVVLIPFLF